MGYLYHVCFTPFPPPDPSHAAQSEETIAGVLWQLDMVERLKPESLASMAQKVRNRFVLAERLVARGKEDNSKLVNQTQRFELWAKNLGLYHLGHSSLDYRFRDAPSLFEYTMGLLRNLDGLLAQCELPSLCITWFRVLRLPQ
jgi:hypothetical protein